jgi:predicted permease
VSWLRNPFNRRRRYDELSESIREHIDEKIADLESQGMSPDEARFAALREFGNVTRIEERSREVWQWPAIEALWADVKYAFRQIIKAPGFSAIAIITLALGIGANTAIFSVVKAVLLAPLPYKDSSRIVAVWTANPARGDEPLPSSPGDLALWKQKSGVFEDMAPSWDNEVTLTGQDSPQYLFGYAVSASYLRILGVGPQIGRLYTDQEDRPGGPTVALLSDHLWRTTFHADPAIVGRAITLDGKRYTVVGVMPPGFNYPDGVGIWMPTAIAPSSLDDFQHRYFRILARLKPGISPRTAQAAVNRLEAQIAIAHPDTDHGNRVVVTPLREELDGDIRMPLLILLGAAGLVLLIACANTAGLALAREAERQKEIAVRLALGATRAHLVRQFMTESLVLGLIGGACGLLLALSGTHSLLRLFPRDVSNLRIPTVTVIPIDGGVLAFALAVTLLTAVLFGLAPVWKATHAQTGSTMKDSARGTTASRSSSRSRNVVVVIEVALSLVLLTAAGLVVASFRNAVNAGLGFEPSHVMAIEVLLPPDRYPAFPSDDKTRNLVDNTVRAMSVVPGVESAAATNFLPLSGFWGVTNFLLRGQAPPKEGEGPEADNRVMTPGYLETMRIPLLRGRAFTAADRPGAEQVALINQTMAAQYFKGRDPVGEELNLGTTAKPDWWRIVGVIGDLKSFGPDQPTHAEIFRPLMQDPFPLVAFTIRTGRDPASMLKLLEQAMWSVDPQLAVFMAVPMDDLAGQTLAIRRASSSLIAGFAILALILVSIGIYGVMAYAVTQRTQEIGVRMALGARRGDVLRLVLASGFRLAAVGIALGVVGALACSHLLASLLFHVSALNPLIFALAALGLAVMAMLAASIPACRAASVDPMRALRAE